MEVDGGSFLTLFFGAVAFAVLGFLVRGVSQFAVDPDTAELLASPLLFGGFALAVAAFLLAVSVKLGLVAVGTGPDA